MRDLAFTCLALLLLVACQGEDPDKLTGDSSALPPPTASLTSVQSPQTSAPTFSVLQVCKAGIGLLMGRDPAAMEGRESAGMATFSYVRKDDGTKWSYRCRLDGDRIVWASDTGRWRTHPLDEVIRYMVDDGKLVVTETFSDGSSRSKTFAASELGP